MQLPSLSDLGLQGVSEASLSSAMLFLKPCEFEPQVFFPESKTAGTKQEIGP
jgi:hypothetical protein